MRKILISTIAVFIIFISLITICSASENSDTIKSHISIKSSGFSWGTDCIIKSNEKAKEIFIDKDSEFFKDIKISSSLSSSGKTLAISALGGDAFFYEEAENIESGFIKDKDGKIMIPFLELLKKIHIKTSPLKEIENGFEIELFPEIIKIEEINSESSLTVEITLSMIADIEQEEANSAISLLFKGATISENAKINLKTIKSDIEKKESGTAIIATFPENRKGFSLTKAYSDKASIEFLPSFNLSGGYASERIENLSFTENSVTIQASGPFRYFWYMNKTNGDITLEIPMVSKPSDISIPDNLKDIISSSFLNTSYGVLGISIKANKRFSFSNPNKNTLTIKFGNEEEVNHEKGFGITGLPENKITIVIDPGHGGGDAGAVNKRIGVSEKVSNMVLSKELGKILSEYGYNVVFTRTTDRDVTWANSPDAVELQARSDIANANSADVFLSVHCNASVNKNANGFAVYWTKESDKKLAEYFKLSPSTGVKDRGAIHGKYYVLRHANMPSVIIETLFISNDKEAKMLKNPKFIKNVMKDCADSVDRYIRENHINKNIDKLQNK